MKKEKYYLGIYVSKGYADFTLLDGMKNPPLYGILSNFSHAFAK